MIEEIEDIDPDRSKGLVLESLPLVLMVEGAGSTDEESEYSECGIGSPLIFASVLFKIFSFSSCDDDGVVDLEDLKNAPNQLGLFDCIACFLLRLFSSQSDLYLSYPSL